MSNQTKSKRIIHHVDPHKIKKSVGDSEKTKLTFSTRLNDLISEKGISQGDFANKTGLSMSSISTYRNGKAEPKISALNEMANTLEVSTDFLLGITDIRDRKPEMKEACEFTGLSEEAIRIIKNFTESNNKRLDYHKYLGMPPEQIEILNTLFETGFVIELLKAFELFILKSANADNFVRVGYEKEPKEKQMRPLAWALKAEISDAIEDVINEIKIKYIHT